jgi:hypothetical protein
MKTVRIATLSRPPIAVRIREALPLRDLFYAMGIAALASWLFPACL